MDALFFNALAPNTRACYNSAWVCFCAFISTMRLPSPYGVTEDILCFYVAYLALKKSITCFSTVHKYLYAVRSKYIDAGLPDPLRNRPIFDRVCTGLKREMRGTTHRARHPITVALLGKLLPFFDIRVRSERLMRHIFTICIFGLLRLEATLKPNAVTYPRRRDVVFASDGTVQLWLAHSKTDQFGKGHFVRFAPTSDRICPVASFKEVFADFPDLGPDGPLFPMVLGDCPSTGVSAMTGAVVIKRLQSAVRDLGDPSMKGTDVNGHSFRKGGAQTLFDAGCDFGTIRLLGRWSSWCVELYASLSTTKVQQVMLMMPRTT